MFFDRLNKLGGRERAGLLLAIACILFLVLDNLVIRPMNERYRALDADIDTEAKTLVYHDDVLDSGGTIEERFREVQTRLGVSMPPAEAIAHMKGEIDTLARQNDLVLLSIKHREPQRTDYYEEYIVDVGDFESDEPSLLRFLHGLRALPGAFKVSKLKIAPDRSGGLVKGSMTITKVMMLPAPE